MDPEHVSLIYMERIRGQHDKMPQHWPEHAEVSRAACSVLSGRGRTCTS